MKCIRRPHSRWTTCSCPECVAWLRKVSKYKRAGRLARVPAADAWERIDQWLAEGFEPRWIESACNIPAKSIQSAIREARSGPRRNFGAVYSARIVAADIWSATEGRASARGARRRLQALQCMGWTNEVLALETGISFVTLANIQRGSCSKVAARLHHPIAAVYDQLAELDGGSRLAKIRAEKRDYLPPAAWDDPDTDGDFDPDDVVVDDVAIERALTGRQALALTNEERKEAYRRHVADGGTRTSFERLTGIRASRYIDEEAIPA